MFSYIEYSEQWLSVGDFSIPVSKIKYIREKRNLKGGLDHCTIFMDSGDDLKVYVPKDEIIKLICKKKNDS